MGRRGIEKSTRERRRATIEKSVENLSPKNRARASLRGASRRSSTVDSTRLLSREKEAFLAAATTCASAIVEFQFDRRAPSSVPRFPIDSTRDSSPPLLAVPRMSIAGTFVARYSNDSLSRGRSPTAARSPPVPPLLNKLRESY